MGCEDFQVVLSSGHELAEVRRVILDDPRITPDPVAVPFPDSEYFLFVDGAHIIEMESSVAVDGCKLSVRFSVCHPDSVTHVFISLVSRLAELLAAAVSVMEDLPPDVRGDFPTSDLAGLRATVSAALAAKRALWVADFGAERAALRCEDAIRRYVLRLPP